MNPIISGKIVTQWLVSSRVIKNFCNFLFENDLSWSVFLYLSGRRVICIGSGPLSSPEYVGYIIDLYTGTFIFGFNPINDLFLDGQFVNGMPVDRFTKGGIRFGDGIVSDIGFKDLAFAYLLFEVVR